MEDGWQSVWADLQLGTPSEWQSVFADRMTVLTPPAGSVDDRKPQGGVMRMLPSHHWANPPESTRDIYDKSESLKNKKVSSKCVCSFSHGSTTNSTQIPFMYQWDQTNKIKHRYPTKFLAIYESSNTESSVWILKLSLHTAKNNAQTRTRHVKELNVCHSITFVYAEPISKAMSSLTRRPRV